MPGYKSITGMTGMGNARELAEMLRQLGRGRDTVLAHITPEEAQMLRDQGGSGTINPETGLPEFQDEFVDYGESYGNVTGAPVDYSYMTPESVAVEANYPTDMTGFRQPTGFERALAPQPMPSGLQLEANLPSREQITQPVDITAPFRREPIGISTREALPPTPEQPGIAQRAENVLENVQNILSKYPRLTGALGTGLQGAIGMASARRQREAAQRQAEQLRALGTPLRESGEALRQQALSGTLTPQQARQQEVARARARQAAGQRGVTTGTQAAMIENQLSRARAEMSQTNLENALRQINMGNKYDEAALLAAIQADAEYARDIEDLTSRLGGQAMRIAGVQQESRPPAQPAAQRITPQQQMANRNLITEEPSERLRRG